MIRKRLLPLLSALLLLTAAFSTVGLAADIAGPEPSEHSSAVTEIKGTDTDEEDPGPEDPGETEEPVIPAEPCVYCGEVHSGPFGRLVGFIHRLFSVFTGVRYDWDTVYGDGVHDDTIALQRLLDSRREGGGEIVFEEGTYLISECLIVYSNQTLVFRDGARLLRAPAGDRDEPQRYMIAGYSENDPEWNEYNGTHDVTIRGAVIDGNADVSGKLTAVNFVHSKNIVIEDCTFVNGSVWHYIEINSTQNCVIRHCSFDGKSYTEQRPGLTNELVQIDAATAGVYGRVYDHRGQEIDFLLDDTACDNIELSDNIFICYGAPAFGTHTDFPHANISFLNNRVEGLSGDGKRSRGFIALTSKIHDMTIAGNTFVSELTDSPALCYDIPDIAAQNIDIGENAYIGFFDDVEGTQEII